MAGSWPSGWPRPSCRRGRMACRSAARSPDELGEQLLAKELENLVEGVARRRPRLVLQVLGEHGVGGGAVAVGVSLRRVDLDADETITELLAQSFETFRRNRPITGES